MATYNGERYLTEQLASIASQSRLPDEIVVCDDGSTDGTLELVQAFANKSEISIHLFRNEIRLGYAENFMEAMRRCSGDIIFICDQDDVWFESKISSVCDHFTRHAESWLVVNDAELTNSSLKPTGLTIGDQVEGVGKLASDHFFGCCMALRTVLLELADPLPMHHAGHDGWISGLASYLKVRSHLALTLQYYRRHGSNASGCVTTQLKKSSRWQWVIRQVVDRKVITPVEASEKRLAILGVFEERLVRDRHRLMNELADPIPLERALGDIRQEIAVNVTRLSFQSRGRVARLIASTMFALRGNYRGFEGWKSWVRDVVG